VLPGSSDGPAGLILFAAPLLANYLLGSVLIMTADAWDYDPERAHPRWAVWLDEVASTPALQSGAGAITLLFDAAIDWVFAGTHRWAYGAGFALTSLSWAAFAASMMGVRLQVGPLSIDPYGNGLWVTLLLAGGILANGVCGFVWVMWPLFDLGDDPAGVDSLQRPSPAPSRYPTRSTERTP
jgi:hypothetical protein